MVMNSVIVVDSPSYCATGKPLSSSRVSAAVSFRRFVRLCVGQPVVAVVKENRTAPSVSLTEEYKKKTKR